MRAVTPCRGDMIEAPAQPSEPRAVVTWAGPGQPITLTLYGPAGEVSVDMTPVRALELAKDLTEPAVVAIKTSQWGEGWPG